ARHLQLKRLVALKMLLAGDFAGPQQLARFFIEGEMLARLQHPNIVQIHEVGTHAGRPYLALEYVEGGTLAGLLQTRTLPARDAAQLVETVARAVHHAHQQGIVHRDLKPANVLLQSVVRSPQSVATDPEAPAAGYGPRTTDYGLPKITDFGLAKQVNAQGLTETGVVLGTPSYLAPEQAQGGRPVRPAADVYALGAIFYELLCGRPPFEGTTPLETIARVLHQEPAPLARWRRNVPGDLQTVCLKCL